MTTDQSEFPNMTSWKEKPLYGSYEKENKIIDKWIIQTNELQRAVAKKHRNKIKRAFHAKGTGVNAVFHINKELPSHLQVGLFQPGAEYKAFVRFSNVMSHVQSDKKKDQRAMGLKIFTGNKQMLLTGREGDEQDILMCNTPVAFARDAIDFMSTVTLLVNQLTLLPKLVRRMGLRAFLVFFRLIVDFFFRAPGIKVSYVAQTYYTRLPIKYGNFAVQFKAVPRSNGPKKVSTSGYDYLRTDLNDRLLKGEVVFDLFISPFKNEKETPIENGTKEWKQYHKLPVGYFIISKQDVLSEALQRQTEKVEFTPWHTTKDFRPLGSMNRARLRVYIASQSLRNSTKTS